MFGIVTPDPFILDNTSLGQTLKNIARTVRSYIPLCGGTFGFGGLEADLAEGGAFAGGIWESDSKKGNTGGSLIEGWLGGEGPLIGAGKISSPSDTSVLQGFIGFVGVGISAGPLAGFQAGYVGGKGWGGLYLEGHGAIWAGGTGGYLRSCSRGE